MKEAIGRLWYRYRGLPMWAQVPLGIFAGLLAIGLAGAPFAEPEDGQQVASEASTTTTPATSSTIAPTSSTASTTTTLPPTTTTTLPPLPAGDDTTVTRITDGDTLVVSDGTRIRLIGVDAPEVESSDCFSSEATSRLRELAGQGTTLRLVYDAERLDRFGRTLAYVYRLPDRLFVNLAMARDGYAMQLTVPPNVRHAEEFRQAVADARNAGRGLWGSCPATTTTAVPATTRPTTASPAPPNTAGLTAGCHPSYVGACVPVGVEDVDCAGGSGNGPAYVSQKNFRVVGPDVYGLDGNDDDGLACESR